MVGCRFDSRRSGTLVAAGATPTKVVPALYDRFVPGPDLLERDEELAALRRQVDNLVETGAGGAVLVEGAAGMGKTSLLRALLAEVSGRSDVAVLRSNASELELDLAFGAVRQLLTAAVLDLPAGTRSDLLAGPGRPAAAVLGLGEPPAVPVDPLYSMYWVLAGLAEHTPRVLVLDDVHWLDPESARFVAYLSHRVADLPVLLVAAARDDIPAPTYDAVAGIRSIATVLTPRALSAAASCALVDHPDAHRVTGGNPLLLQQLARSGEPAAGFGDAVTRRVQRISPEAVALAEAVSLFGNGTTLQDAATVAGLSTAEAASAADALVAERVLAASEDGLLTFAHPLLRSVIYDRLGKFARRTGHARAAAALKDRGASAEKVAAHLLAGEPAGDPGCVQVLRTAAAAAVTNLAPRAAVRYLQRAVDEGVGGTERELLVELGRLQLRIGQPQDAQRALARVFTERDRDHPDAGAAIDLALAAYLNSDHRAVTDVVDAMEPHDLPDDDRLVLMMLLAESAWNTGDVETCVRLIADVPYDLAGSTPAQRFALAMVGAVQMFQCAPLNEAKQTLLRAVGDDGTANLVRGIDVGDPFGWIIFCDALDEAETIIARRLDRARATGDEGLFGWTQNAIGWILTSRGDLGAAEAAFRLGLARPDMSPMMRDQLVINYVEALICRGDFDRASAELDKIEAGSPSPMHVLQIGCRRAQLAVWRGDPSSALAPFEQRIADEEAAGLRHPNARIWIADYADALAGIGRRDEAIDLISELVELSRFTGGTSGPGYHQLTLGRLTGAVPDLERAVDLLEPSPFRWYAARAQLELGAALRRGGQRVRAREHLRLALDYAERHQVRHFSERARDELRLAGAKPRALVLTGIDALTPAELRIALLAAQGRSNKDIAQHLFLTVKTIEATLARAFRKLEVSTRHDLAQIFAETSTG